MKGGRWNNPSYVVFFKFSVFVLLNTEYIKYVTDIISRLVQGNQLCSNSI